MNKLTRTNTKTWETEECTLREYLESNDFYKHTDMGELEQMRNTIDTLENTVLILIDFLEEKHGEELIGKFPNDPLKR